mmetsp:Transcript_93120/g.267102  ORF Transcript_93120/g.267102 Transcript_93120/m.267102 type:complete len:322 (+) Transcript_93120:267-1232(+)
MCSVKSISSRLRLFRTKAPNSWKRSRRGRAREPVASSSALAPWPPPRAPGATVVFGDGNFAPCRSSLIFATDIATASAFTLSFNSPRLASAPLLRSSVMASSRSLRVFCAFFIEPPKPVTNTAFWNCVNLRPAEPAASVACPGSGGVGGGYSASAFSFSPSAPSSAGPRRRLFGAPSSSMSLCMSATERRWSCGVGGGAGARDAGASCARFASETGSPSGSGGNCLGVLVVVAEGAARASEVGRAPEWARASWKPSSKTCSSLSWSDLHSTAFVRSSSPAQRWRSCRYTACSKISASRSANSSSKPPRHKFVLNLPTISLV